MDIVFPMLFLIVVFGGLGYAIHEFLITPKAYRYKLNSSIYNKLKLEKEIALGLAVEIEPQRRKAFFKFIPALIAIAIPLSPAILAGQIKEPGCSRILGYNASYISLLYVCYALPAILTALSLLMVPIGLKTVKSGFFPPLDTISFVKIVSRKGVLSKIRGYSMTVLPLFMILLIPISHFLFIEISKGRDHSEIASLIEEKCISIQSIGTSF